MVNVRFPIRIHIRELKIKYNYLKEVFFKLFNIFFSGKTCNNSMPWSVIKAISLFLGHTKPNIFAFFHLQLWVYSIFVGAKSLKFTNSTVAFWLSKFLCIANILRSGENFIEIIGPRSSILKDVHLDSSIPLTVTPVTPPDLTVNTWNNN